MLHTHCLYCLLQNVSVIPCPHPFKGMVYILFSYLMSLPQLMAVRAADRNFLFLRCLLFYLPSCIMDVCDLDTLEDVSPSVFHSWPGRLCGLAPFDAARDATLPQLHDRTTNLLLSQTFDFRLRLEDSASGESSHSRQVAVSRGFRIKTNQPVCPTFWPLLKVTVPSPGLGCRAGLGGWRTR